MKIYNKNQMRAMEEAAVKQGTSMTQLMENAGFAAVCFMQENWKLYNKKIVILCGKGNNGGDGFVAARHLFKLGAFPVVILAEAFPKTELAKEAYGKMGVGVQTLDWNREGPKCKAAIEEADFIIDAIYGFGFHGEMEEKVARLAKTANEASAVRISLDIPSGAQCDDGAVNGACICANHTVTFSAPKPAHFFYPSKQFCGKVSVLPAGISEGILQKFPCELKSIEEPEVASLFLPRNPQSNKGDFGKLLCVCGSEGMAGAAVMSAMAALRCGAGLVQLAVPRSIYPIAASKLPEAIFILLDFDENGNLLPQCAEKFTKALKQASCCLLGCGLGQSKPSEKLFYKTFSEISCPIILDADGINVASRHIDVLRTVGVPMALTPHPGEMARLLNATSAQVQSNRLDCAKKFVDRTNTVLVLKGAGTLIADSEKHVFINTTGNPGMARGGSGDILAGMIASFAAQGMSLINSAKAAVYLHGKAGDRCAAKLSQQAMLPTDIIRELPQLFLQIEQNR